PNKCLAQSNKSRTGAYATNKRGALPAARAILRARRLAVITFTHLRVFHLRQKPAGRASHAGDSRIISARQTFREGGMAKIVRRETRKRGFFGWIFLLLFLGFNALMVRWLVSYWSAISDGPSSAGHAIGATIGTGMIFFFWTAGAVITGLFALLTRGRK